MSPPQDEEELLRSASLQNARSILAARQRAEQELRSAKEDLERRTQELAQSLARMRATLESTAEGILVTDGGERIADYNEKYAAMWHVPDELVASRDHVRVIEFIAGQFAQPEAFLARIREIQASEPSETFDVLELADGRVFERASKVQLVDERHTGRVWSVRDITQRVLAERSLREETQALELLNRTGLALASKLDTQGILQTVTDAATEITGAQFGAFFFNTRSEEGESYTLYTLSGVPRETFANFPLPRATALFGPTFRGEGIVRSDDVLADSRYGRSAPHHGMPPGHLPVRSYLAVPVVSRSGTVHGGLFFGHATVGMFTARDESIVAGMAAHAAVAIDNAGLFEASERSRKQLQEVNETLEKRVVERTDALREAEQQLQQSQKMEAIGQLTGGVAHDFNNLLTVILGNLDTIWRKLPTDEGRVRRATEQATRAAERAATLTHQLLAFSRRQALNPKPTDLNRLVTDVSEMLRRTLGESVSVETVLGGGLWRVEVDANQLENALLNLAINARDAMPGGGKLTIETANAHLDDEYTHMYAEISPGQYVVICVSDTGGGMSPEVMAKAFEPFFTTKGIGEGTGLGLSQVYGFVKQTGGHIKLYSEPGHGTTVKIYLPRLLGDVLSTDAAQSPIAPTGRLDETILVVEDDHGVRVYSVETLRELGYSVLEASDAMTALRVLDQHPEVQLLFTDVGLPGLNGRELMERARKKRPDLGVLFTTGYARNAIVHHGRLDPGVDLLTKPFTKTQLAMRVRDVLDVVGRY